MVAGSARRLIRAGAVVLSCAVLSGACGSRPKESASQLNPPGGLGLRPVTLPDFSGMEASVRAHGPCSLETLSRPGQAQPLQRPVQGASNAVGLRKCFQPFQLAVALGTRSSPGIPVPGRVFPVN